MPRVLASGGALLLVLGILAAVALTRELGRSEPAPPAAAASPAAAATFDGVALTYRGPGQRSASYSSFQVQFSNGTADAMTNPQTRVFVKLQDREWRCQGYSDPASGTVVWLPADVSHQPLVIPAGQQVDVEILCRVPDAPLETAQLRIQ